jgi:hypothetical protein
VEGLRLAGRGQRQLFIAKIDGEAKADERLHRALLDAGFQHGYKGYSYKGEVVSLHA